MLQRSTNSAAGRDAVVVSWITSITEFLGENNLSWAQIAGVGLAIPGQYERYGVLGKAANLPASFATFAAYGDFATGILALLALLTVRIRPLFWLFIVAFNLVGVADLVLDYYHATRDNLPAIAGQLGVTYAIVIIFVPLLMITHIAAFYLLARAPRLQAAR